MTRRQNPTPLRAVPALASFSDDQLDDVLNSSSLLQCESGDCIIKEGSIDSRIYVLLSGELEVRVGGKKVAAITRIGEVFGELALVNQDRRLASVIASTKAVCLAVDQKFLQDIHPREEDPDFHASLYEFVARLVVRKLEATSKAPRRGGKGTPPLARRSRSTRTKSRRQEAQAPGEAQASCAEARAAAVGE
jgi:CRP/FNR family cyclic AMP-dependent transcriptional regulator